MIHTMYVSLHNYHVAVIDKLSLIALDAYDFMCHSRAEYYIGCYVYVIPNTMFFPLLVLCVRLKR
jgi:hypothetical protein